MTELDEAYAVQDLVAEVGLKKDAALKMGKSAGWVTQRLYLVNLTDSLKAKLTEGVLLIGDARELGKLPEDEQEAAWRARLEQAATKRASFTAVKDGGGEGTESGPSGRPRQQTDKTRRSSRISFAEDESPLAIAQLLRDKVPHDSLVELVEALKAYV